MNLFRYFTILFALLIPGITQADELYKVPSVAMEPTVPKGSMVFIQTIKSSVQRGDIVLFRWPVDLTTPFLMRVIGLPGDHVQMRGERILINGTVVPRRPVDGNSETFEEELGEVKYKVQLVGKNYGLAVSRMHEGRANRCEYAYKDERIDCVVPEDQFFVLGDHRNNSNDSRMWGYVPSALLMGKLAR
ncbi:signal peptidase I Serine peptidase. MEROPS family S26A [Duganella sp. CF458]|uniref:signal peptidase I n=1 Tax=Duganella sp. CF458 TaxID=1884368 RepID=UPI0008ED6E78|nr:signal peptidase I [Duganella sp. CF458]SFG79285.1 signal peptidase I Serine peptidase. MEROPS family S26A [Duganella sp. CF458]